MSDKQPTANPASGAIDVDESAIERWSRRKEMARQGRPLPDDDEAPDGQAADAGNGETAAAPEEGNQRDVTASSAEPPELPPLESLTGDSDYSAFMASEVSPDLRRQALRKLFQSPKFNVRDGLDDYDLDYTNPEPLGNIVTAEMRRRILREIERLADAGTDDDTAEQPIALADKDAGTGVAAEAQPDAGEDADDDRPGSS